ncbi:hypothetical protein PILCRDRAFT_51331, partial [Piloderma croceum F 1598]
DFEPNDRADKEAKKAAQGLSSDAKSLPQFLHKKLPASVSALRQNFNNHLLKRWKRRWKSSPCFKLHRSIDNSAPSKKFMRLT